ncbi:MAG: hypothetical protein JSW25_04985, partial [Thermoplasmata archaeon]
MRLRVGILLGIVPFILIGAALASSWYSIHAVGPDFRTVGPDGPEPWDERRQLDGEWTLYEFRYFNETWDERDMNPAPGWVTSSIKGEGRDPHAYEVY